MSLEHERVLRIWYATGAETRLIAQPLWWNAYGHDLGALNEFQGHLGQLKRETRERALNAQSAQQWVALAVLSRIIAECTQGHYRFVKIVNH